MSLSLRAESFGEVLKRLELFCLERNSCQYVSLNAYSLYCAQRDAEFKKALSGADYVSADGASIVLAGRFFGCPVPERVTGYDLACALAGIAAGRGWRVHCLGVRLQVLQRLQAHWLSLYPNLRISIGLIPKGINGSPLDLTPRELCAISGAHLVLVALPSPDQEKWIARNRRRVPAGLWMGVGGAFEAITGEIRRAPFFLQRLGLEWLYRFLQQPGRRWKKTFISTVWFGVWFLRKIWSRYIRYRKALPEVMEAFP